MHRDTKFLMFRFWSSDSRGRQEAAQTPESSATPTDLSQELATEDTTTTASRPAKRSRADSTNDDSLNDEAQPKRARFTVPENMRDPTANAQAIVDSFDGLEDKIESAFSTQILLKNEEKRQIDVEIAKCQAALEQLRRCHLIPFPTNCPTPEQMLDISAGKGHALQRPGEPVPKWAAPFGVVEGPYASHYARWLLPHKVFDGVEPEEQLALRGSFAEGRTTRNSFAEPVNGTRGRPARGAPGPKLQALPSGQPQRKEKGSAGPCVLKRPDGQVVKLVCLDCHRENFSSTQGFINHCRIAHKRTFETHEEAAIKSGQPYTPSETESTPTEERPVAQAQSQAQSQAQVQAQAPVPRQSAFVCPLARDDVTYEQAVTALRARLSEPIKAYNNARTRFTAEAKSIRAATNKSGETPTARKDGAFEPSSETPYLSRLLQSRKFSGDLHEMLNEAKSKLPLDDMLSGDEDEADEDSSASKSAGDAPPARVPVVKRVPARSGKSPAPITAARPASSKGRGPAVNLVSQPGQGSNGTNTPSDEDVEMEAPSLSPNTIISNNAPSLVSDDGEYDDSDEGSSVSGQSEDLDTRSVSDVAEINLDDEHESRSLRRTSTGVANAVRLRREDPKHVSFVSPMASNRGEKRKRKA